ncbi:MAG: glycoside hydrolase family 15 protein [Oligoflexia bacterium]|nr:glycoside hydrolase family 15 protein [Oligoflexia bacterium]
MMYNHGLIGNCNISALISERGSLDWLCLPRPDSEPVFGKILDQNGGEFSIQHADDAHGQWRQSYLENTNILCTQLEDKNGNAFQIIDFCPRFEQHGRMFRPLSLVRIIEPVSGSPSIKVVCEPINGWNKQVVKPSKGNSHVSFEIRNESLRLTTNMPLTYLTDQTPFLLKDKLYFCLSWNSAVEEDLAQLCERFLSQTEHYWKTWVKHCSIPSLFQQETIRSALTLKLHCFEDTGAILAALTTSLPEEPGGGRNWDYRYCWLRDAYFVLSAFHNLGHFEEMEGFLKFLLDIAHHNETSKERLAPVYTLSRELPLPETIHSNWTGYKNHAPIRSNNQAAEHVQNDVYGEMILTLAPIFFDHRFVHLRTKEHEELLEHLAKLAVKTIGQPDAGLWEIRNGWQEHTFTNLMSWAGLERLQRIQKQGYLKGLSIDIEVEKSRAEHTIEKAIRDGSVRNGPQDESFDAALSLFSVLRYPNEAVTRATLEQIGKVLAVEGSEGSLFYRYTRKDDFGTPQAAFVVCSFWIAQALARIGKNNEAKSIMTRAMQTANHLGLYSEHFMPSDRQQLGNFPQAYSHVGQINAAFAISPPWIDVL